MKLELKTKYQYTYFLHPYIIEESKYEKYLLKLLKDKRCKYKIFEKEKDLDIYNFFLPNVRSYLFPSFDLRGEKLRNFEKMGEHKKAKQLASETVAYFTYDLAEDVQGKVETEDGIFFKIEEVEIICFQTGICFFAMKTHLENTNNFSDVLDFNYRFKGINSEFVALKNYEKIKIQTDTFNDIKDISEFIKEITGVYKKKYNTEQAEITNSQFYTYSYVCLESNQWNEKNSFEYLEDNFLKFANVLPNHYNSDFDKTNIEHNLHVIEKLKYVKTSLSNTSSNIICSGIDTYNYTKLPYEYENQYFYTYMFSLYKLMFLRKLNLDFKNYDKIVKMRVKFAKFTKDIWDKEITLDDTGSLYYKTLNKTLQLEELYEEIKNKYEVIYKDLNIEKNNNYYSIIVILLIFSLIFNTINILFLMYFLS